MSIKIEHNIPLPDGGAKEIRKYLRSARKLKTGKSSFLIDYMTWSRIGPKVRLVLKTAEGIELLSRRESGQNVKKTRVWRVK